MQKLHQETNLKKQKYSNLFIFSLLFMVALLAVIRIAIANQMVGASEKLRLLDSQIAKTQAQNQLLSENLRESESLTQKEDQLAAAGFKEVTKLSYVKSDSSVALLLNVF